MKVLTVLAIFVLTLGHVQSAEDCELVANLAILLHSSTNETMYHYQKNLAIDVSLSLDLTKSRVGLWQVSDTVPLDGFGLGDVDETSVRTKIDRLTLDPAAFALNKARRALLLANSTESNPAPMAIIYITAKPFATKHELIAAADLARNDGIAIRAISVGLEETDVEDLFALTGGGISKVLQLTDYSTDPAASIKQFLCSSVEDFNGQNFCFGICWG